MTAKGEGIQWIMLALNTLHSFFDTVGGISDKIPEQWKQRFPGFLGLSLDDEQIFNGVLGQISKKKQIVITSFLREKCKDYERNRFINIVAGMTVDEIGKKEEKNDSFDNNGKKVTNTTITSGNKRDKRQDFLEKFADIITKEFQNDHQKAYDYCIGGRMIITDPLNQKALKAFSESVGWFKKIVLMPFGVDSIEGLLQKAKQRLSENPDYWDNKVSTAKAKYEAARAAKRKA